jgi:hypothetical protein
MSALVAADIKRMLNIPFVVTFHALGIIPRIFQGPRDGFPADYLVSHQLIADYSFKVQINGSVITLLKIANWNLFFIISALMALASLKFLRQVKENGEVEKNHVVVEIFSTLRTRIEKREFFRFTVVKQQKSA